jgi:hypothetical protein
MRTNKILKMVYLSITLMNGILLLSLRSEQTTSSAGLATTAVNKTPASTTPPPNSPPTATTTSNSSPTSPATTTSNSSPTSPAAPTSSTANCQTVPTPPQAQTCPQTTCTPTCGTTPNIYSSGSAPLVENTVNVPPAPPAPAPAPTSVLPLPMPNNNYLFVGYNIAFGNPHITDGSIDPGLVSQIFASKYTQGIQTSDYRFLVPDGSYFERTLGCDISMRSTEIRGQTSYSKSLQIDASAFGSVYGFSFQASADFKSVSSGTTDSQNVFIESKADCKVYSGHLDYYSPPLFADEFVKAVASLKGLSYSTNKAVFHQFFNYYGTHYIESIRMGSKFGYLYELRSNSYTTMNQQGYDVTASASYSGFFNAGGSFGINQDSQAAQTFSQSVSDSKIFTIGSLPPVDNSPTTWAQDSLNEPMPITYKLRPIFEIFTNKFFDLSQFTAAGVNSALFGPELTNALNSYCADYLLPNTFVNNCFLQADSSSIGAGVHKVPVNPTNSNNDDFVFLRNIGTNMCLMDNGSHEYVVSNDCNSNNDAQKWIFALQPPENYWVISNTDGNMYSDCLEDCNVFLYDSSEIATPNKWFITTYGQYYVIYRYSPDNFKYCLEMAGGNINFSPLYQKACVAGNIYQQFEIFKIVANN